MKAKFWLLGVLGVIGLSTILFVNKSEKEVDVESFEKFITNHEFYKRKPMTQKELKAINKADRPDLAWEQNFLTTMDPKLMRPTPEVLKDARKQIKDYFDNGGAKQVPGSVNYPWIERGPSNVGGRTRAIAWDPNDPAGKKVWAGGVTGGLWFNDDITSSSSSWTHVDDFWDNISITSIAFDPINSQIIYVGTGEGWGAAAARGEGIWKSIDGGVSWNQIGSTSSMAYVNDIVVRDEGGSEGVVYVGTGRFGYQGASIGTKGLYRSIDGSTFTEVLPGSEDIGDLEIAADNAIFAGTRNGKVYKSYDGTTWDLEGLVIGDERTEIACAPSNPDVLYVIYEKNNKVDQIHKSEDGGATWTGKTKPADVDNGIPDDDFTRGQAWYDLIAAVDPNNENTLIVGGIDLFRTTDGGGNWEQISKWSNNNNLAALQCSRVHADQHNIVFKEGSSEEVIFGNDGGVFYTSSLSTAQNSNVISARNKDYNVTQFYACAQHPDASSNYSLAGSQDNGTQKFTITGFGNTTTATGGDGAYCFIDQTDPKYQITSYVYNNYYLSTNNGGSFFTTIIGDGSSGSFINPADYDDQEDILYTNKNASGFYRVSNISGTRVEETVSAALGAKASNLKVSPFSAPGTSTLFIGTSSGRIYRIDDAQNGTSVTPTRIESGLSSGSVTSIEFGASQDEIMVTYGNYGVPSVWFTEDGGTNWQNKEGNLPNMPVRWGLINQLDGNEAILATELGVWATYNFKDADPTWVPSNEGLANVRVDMLQYRASDHMVIAATHGRGLYESNGFAYPTLPLNALFSANSTDVNVNQPVTFSDESNGNPNGWTWSFPGGTPSTFVGQNPPDVRYSLPGCYDVLLTVSNGERDTSRTKSCYINVGIYDGPCVPETNSGTVDGDFINGVQLEQINNTNTGAQGGLYYNNFTSMYASLELAQSYTVTISSGTNGPNDYFVWIDYNGDNILQDPEERIGKVTIAALSSQDINFTVPASAAEGYRLMRVKCVYNSTDDTGPCSDNEWGEVEDYGIQLIDNINPPKIVFEASNQLITVGESVNFTDLTTGSPSDWNWNLADGLPATSNEQHPFGVIFNNPGCKDISLTATNSNGTNTKTEPCFVEVVEPPVSLFTASDTVIEVGERVDFTDESLNNPDTWSWEFEGATIATSSAQNPQNIKYLNAGCYAVTLSTSYKGISREPLVKTCYITVVEPYNTYFSVSENKIATGQTVDFYDQSGGWPTEWEWTFEGATPSTSTEENPSGILYSSAGCYKVSLKPSKDGIEGDLLERNCYIEVIDAPKPNFVASTTTTRIGEPVKFFDLTPTVTSSWNWIFGGSLTPTSTEQNPTIVFDTVGCFDVTLTVFNNDIGSEPKTKTCYINVDYGVGISENQSKHIQAYPNPANEYVFIPNTYSVSLLDYSGKVVNVEVVPENEMNKILVSNLPSGIYMLMLKNDKTTNFEKIIIQH